MPEYINIKGFSEQLRFIPDDPKGSVLILFKPSNTSPNSERYLIKFFVLENGGRKEILNHIIDNSDFNSFYIYPNHTNQYHVQNLIEQLNNLQKDNNDPSLIYFP